MHEGGDLSRHGTAVELRDLTLTAGGRVLLEKAAAHFEPGEVTLIVGPSGAGKSLLLRLMAGLHDRDSRDVTAEGQVCIGEYDMLAGRPCAKQAPGSGNRLKPRLQPLTRTPPVGVVLQSFALFDELSPLDNVRFARDHRPRQSGAARKRGIGSIVVPPSDDDPQPDSVPAPPPEGGTTNGRNDPEALLCELHVPKNVRTAALSGGQRQRLALARTLAYEPEVILYDEPTSGLDVATAEQVAQLIRSTHATHPQTSIIVTHDYEALCAIADRVYLFDVRARALVEVPREAWGTLHERLSEMRSAAAGQTSSEGPKQGAPPVPESPSNDHRHKFLTRVGDFLAGTSRCVEQVLLLPTRLVPLWRSPAWGLRTLWHYLKLVASPSAWLYMAIAGAIAGYVATYFTFRFLPYRQYTEPLLIENVLHALGFSLYRILVPVLATILIAARCGAAVASDLGGKVYGRQIDALRTFGVRPQRYLLTGVLYAFLLGAPLLVAIAFLAARWASLGVFAASHPQLGLFFWESHFHRDLVEPGQWFYQGTGWLLAKVLCCAAGMALIAYLRGMQPKHSTSDVSRGITSNILWSTLWVLVVHFAFAFYEF